MVSASLWFANAPGLPLGQPSYTTASSNEAEFIKQVRASLKEDASEPPVEHQVRLEAASKREDVSEPSAEPRWFLQNASLGKGYLSLQMSL